MNIVFASNHHRRSIYFEDTIRTILPLNQRIVIQNTGGSNGFGEFGIVHDNITVFPSNDQITYDQGMELFHSRLLMFNWDMVVFLDNDLFLKGTNYLTELIDDFQAQKYDFCSYFEFGSEYTSEYEFRGKIAEVRSQTFKETAEFPGFKPVPHWENAYMLLTRETYEKLTIGDVSNGRKWIKALHQMGAKMGAHHRESRLQYSHCGTEWFHVGNLMRYYYLVDNLSPVLFNPADELDCSRLGYFLSQREKHGRGIYDTKINQNLDFILNKDKCIEAWKNLTRGYDL